MTKRSVYVIAIGLMVLFLCAAGAQAKEEKKTELKPMLKVTPLAHTFNCQKMERAKEIVATNLSKKAVAIGAQATDAWIKVEPKSQDEVRPMGKALFTVSVNCDEVKMGRTLTGYVALDSMGSIQKVRIVVKPKLLKPGTPGHPELKVEPQPKMEPVVPSKSQR